MRNMRHTILILTMAIAMMLGGGGLSAQTIGGASKGGDLIRAGESALAKGQYQAAQGHFAKALRSSDLTDVQVAKALYQRGVANERIERPAQAIADITSALYLPSLAGADRAKAYLSRGRAYEAVGMSELARADISRAKNGGVSERQVARSSQPAQSGSGGPTFATSSQSAGGRASGQSFDTQVQSSGSRTPAPSFSTRTNAPSSTSKRQRVASFETQTRAAPIKEEAIPSFRTTILPQDGSASASSKNSRTASRSATGAGASWNTAANPEQAAAEKDKESDSKVGRFFGKVWSKATGGDDDKKQPAPAGNPAPVAAPQWNQTTNVARAPQPKPNWNAQVSSATQATPPPAASVSRPQPSAASSGGRGYRIQLAALRSDTEAQATWKRLQSKHKKFLGARQPNIVRTELGGLGTFYRVQLGPFADKASSQNLCKEFKSGGLDCFLLAP
jgi:tetratricopeptide (TPR) repeat protein